MGQAPLEQSMSEAPREQSMRPLRQAVLELLLEHVARLPRGPYLRLPLSPYLPSQNDEGVT